MAPDTTVPSPAGELKGQNQPVAPRLTTPPVSGQNRIAAYHAAAPKPKLVAPRHLRSNARYEGRGSSTVKPAFVPLKSRQNGDERPVATGPLPRDAVKLIALGGFGEIGKNVVVYEYQNDILVIDCGEMLPEEDMLGIDLVIPDVRYLVENKDRIRGWIFTHGHEDHIGGVPFIIPKDFASVPIYAGNLTAKMIEYKLEEFGVKHPNISIVKPGDKLKLGSFALEFVQVAHSIPDDLAVVIDTPEGRIVHVPDWKIDHTPLWLGQVTDIARLAELGNEGVDLYVGESTNVTRPGYTPSEQIVAEAYDKIFKENQGRIIVAMFSSLINRVQQIFNVAEKYRRKVAVSGRSMEKNISIAMELGYLKVPQGLLVDLRSINRQPDSQIVILTTGAQGEDYSGLVRMAAGEHRQIRIKRGDAVIISASPIAGNEGAVAQTIDNLFREGATVYHGADVDIHVSGHAHVEELKMMLAILKPKYFIPQHGEYRMLRLHARLAQKIGVPSENTFIIENGMVALLKEKKVSVSPVKVQSGGIFVDGLGVGDVGNIVLRDRQAMAKDGIFVAILSVDRTGKILTSPDIISRGFIYMRDREDLVSEARHKIREIFDRHNAKYPLQYDYIKRAIREELGEFLFDRTQRRPMVIPVVIEV